MNFQNRLNKPIFILGAHKSGTSFFRALLDAHQELQVVPIEAHYFQHLGLSINNPIRKAYAIDNSDLNFKSSIFKLINEYNTSNDLFADTYLTGKFNLNIVKELLKREIPNDDTYYLINYINYLIFQSLNHNYLNKDKRIVEKSVENYEFASYLKILFPNAYFIHILRNPYQNLASLVKARGFLYSPVLLKFCNTIKNSFVYANNNKKLIENYTVIKYEDLLINLEKEMRKIAIKLDIEYSDSLMEPTVLGQPWKTNSTRINETNEKGFKDHTPSYLEIFYINMVMRELITKWKYKIILPNKYKFFIPGKNEAYKNYFKNRIHYILN